MNNLNVLTWNINQRGGSRVKSDVSKESCGFITATLTEQNADVVILTEFYRDNECGTCLIKELQNLGYTISILPEDTRELIKKNAPKGRGARNGINEVLIAIRESKKLDVRTKAQGDMSVAGIFYSGELYKNNATTVPNFLQVNIRHRGEHIIVIGTRIRVCNGDKQDFLMRKHQLDHLLAYLSKLPVDVPLIVTGDFNNGFMYPTPGYVTETLTYAQARPSYLLAESNMLDTFNYHIMRDAFAAHDMQLHTPDGKSFSWGFLAKNKWKGYVKADHFVTRGMTVTDITYSTHLFNKNTKPPYPDHAILTANMSLVQEPSDCYKTLQ
jgi:exonuclease III